MYMTFAAELYAELCRGSMIEEKAQVCLLLARVMSSTKSCPL
jgi:hypothetical protein